ncbi:MAG: hypothetical protein ABMA64_15555 [Myxococcota bacterium]
MWVLAWLLSGPSLAVDADVTEEVVVWGDLFARWDDTRWSIANEIGMPFPFFLRRDENLEFASTEMVVKAVIGCSKEWKLSGRKFEVGCEIEDFAIQASMAEDRVNDEDIARAQSVLDEVDAKLTGAKLQLQVSDDGRVTNVSLEGITAENARQRSMEETLTQILSRLIGGFDLKLRKYNQLNEGKWHEYNAKVLAIPRPPEYTNAGQTGSNLVVHYLNRYRGHLMVQSIGKGLEQLTVAGQVRNFTLDLIGVSIFDEREGYMLERVWAIKGVETASSFFSSGGYYNNGRIAVLGTADKPDLGPSRVVNGSRQNFANLPPWERMEQPSSLER